MPVETVFASDFIQLGRSLQFLFQPALTSATIYQKEISTFIRLLKACGMKRTAIAARSMESLTIEQLGGRISPQHSRQLESLLSPIWQTLSEESHSMMAIVSDENRVPHCLLELPSKVGGWSESHQSNWEDACSCLRVGACRPAIIMTWALGLDILRTWIISDQDRLAEFNQILRKRTQNDGQRQIVQYQDFFAVKEVCILEICRDGVSALASFTSKTHRQMQSLLDDRNTFAHANDFDATQTEAIAYVERLIRLMTSSPFGQTELRPEGA